MIVKIKKKKVTALEVNKYLSKYGKFKSKEFRTWAANKLFIQEILKKKKIPKDEKKNKKALREIEKICSQKMIHSPAMYRKEYLCPDLRNLYIEKPKLLEKLIHEQTVNVNGLKNDEQALMSFLNNYYNNKYCKKLNNKVNNNKKNKNNEC